jgi:hypothetical protein
MYYPFMFLLTLSVFHFGWVSFGLSLVVAGLIGLLIPSLIIFLNKELKLQINSPKLFLSLTCLTGLMIIFPYFRLEFYYLILTLSLIGLGLYLGKSEIFKIWSFIGSAKRLEKGRKEAFAVLLVFFIHFVGVLLLFPSNIVQSSGMIVNIFAHYFGVFFGLFVPYYLLPKDG